MLMTKLYKHLHYYFWAS